MIFSIIKFLVIILLICTVLGIIRTWQMDTSEKQKLFLFGVVPSLLPDGLYTGTVTNVTVSWRGKKFDATNKTGINIFEKDGQLIEKYPFRTSVAGGIRGKNQVIKIDYNIAENPLWLRLVLDEIVEVSPGKYLGKLNLRIVPGYPFTLGYFEMEK